MKTTGTAKRLLVLLFSLLVCPLFLSCINGWMDELWARFDKEEPDPIPEKPKDPYADYRLLGPDDLTFNAGLGQITAYKGPVPAGNVRIPEEIDGKPVYYIGSSNIVPFAGRGLTGVIIPNSTGDIPQSAFQDNQLTSVIIGSSISSIGNYAFYNNPIISVTFIGNGTISWGGTFCIDNEGNLRSLYQTGGAGTYTRPDATSTNWEKQ